VQIPSRNREVAGSSPAERAVAAVTVARDLEVSTVTTETTETPNYHPALFHAWYASVIDCEVTQAQSDEARAWWERVVLRYRLIADEELMTDPTTKPAPAASDVPTLRRSRTDVGDDDWTFSVSGEMPDGRRAVLVLDVRRHDSEICGDCVSLHVEDPAGVACPWLGDDRRCDDGPRLHGAFSYAVADEIYTRRAPSSGRHDVSSAPVSEGIWVALETLWREWTSAIEPVLRVEPGDVRPAVAVADESPVGSPAELVAKYGPRGLPLLIRRALRVLSGTSVDAEFLAKLAIAATDLASALAGPGVRMCHRCCVRPAAYECTERRATWRSVCESCFEKDERDQYLYVPPDGRRIAHPSDAPLAAALSQATWDSIRQVRRRLREAAQSDRSTPTLRRIAGEMAQAIDDCAEAVCGTSPFSATAWAVLRQFEGRSSRFAWRDQEVAAVRELAEELTVRALDCHRDYPIGKLELTIRVIRVLHDAGIWTVGDLVQKTPADVLRLSSGGRNALHEIRETLAERGLRLADDAADAVDVGTPAGDPT
jgi:hypothetical protein